MGGVERGRDVQRGVFTVLYPFEGAGHGLGGEYGPIMQEQSSYFLYYALNLNNAAR